MHLLGDATVRAGLIECTKFSGIHGRYFFPTFSMIILVTREARRHMWTLIFFIILGFMRVLFSTNIPIRIEFDGRVAGRKVNSPRPRLVLSLLFPDSLAM